MTAPRESELKLDLTLEEGAALARRGLGGRVKAGRSRRLVGVYYDTPEGRLREHGLTLRIRDTAEGFVQTVKAAGEAGAGLFDRGEWERPVAGSEPDLAAAEGSPLADILGDDDELRPVFESRVERTTWTVNRRGASLEVSLDIGEVVGEVVGEFARDPANSPFAEPTSPFAELEIELISGDPAEIFALARSLARETALRIGVLTKSERGYALLDGSSPAFVKATRPVLHVGMTAAGAFQAIARGAVRQFRLNEALLAGEDPVEALHQARVALRRLRSAVSLFRDVVADGRVEAIGAGLRDASRLLGEARNLDVYLAQVVEPGLAGAAPPPGLPEYRAFIESERRRRDGEIADLLGSAAFRLGMLDLVAWIETGPWLANDDPLRAALRDRPVGDMAAEVLARQHRRVAKRGRHLDRLDPEARHRVRIAAKKLRYASEFFGSLVARKAERRRYTAFLEALERLQDALGDLNDVATGHAIAERFAGSAGALDHAAALFAAGRLSGGEDRRAEDGLEAAAKAQRKVARAKPFWTHLSAGPL